MFKNSNAETAGIIIGIFIAGALAYYALGWVWCLITVIVCYCLVMWEGGKHG